MTARTTRDKALAQTERRHARELGSLAKALAERRTAGGSSATLKLNAKQELQPDVTIAAGESDAAVEKMVRQCREAFTALLDAGSES